MGTYNGRCSMFRPWPAQTTFTAAAKSSLRRRNIKGSVLIRTDSGFLDTKRKNPRNREISRIFLELLGRFELPTSSLPKLRIKFYMVSVRVIKCPIIPLVPMPISILELFSIAPYCSVFSGLLEDLLEENISIF